MEPFTTANVEPARRGTVHAQGGTFPDAGLESCGTSGWVGNRSGAPLCACDTTYTQRPPECDPSEQTLCAGDTLCG